MEREGDLLAERVKDRNICPPLQLKIDYYGYTYTIF